MDTLYKNNLISGRYAHGNPIRIYSLTAVNSLPFQVGFHMQSTSVIVYFTAEILRIEHNYRHRCVSQWFKLYIVYTSVIQKVAPLQSLDLLPLYA